MKVEGTDYDIGHGDVVIAAITSCTNTSNPSVLVAAGLVARNARAKGLKTKPWVKTSLAPGSQVVTDYLAKANLQVDLDALGFNLAGYGCTTCIGNSGPLPDNIADAIRKADLVAAAVLSGNRNFEGRVNADVKANYLASPPLVVAYALAGTLNLDLTSEPLGIGSDGKPVFLKDIWPSSAEVAELIRTSVTPDMFDKRYKNVFAGDERWQAMGKAKPSLTYRWNSGSTYVQNPPYFEDLQPTPAPIGDVIDARMLGLFLDSITTDHISPAGSIKKDGPAGVYLIEHQVRPHDFNSYGARRGNHNVMMRGTFANIRIKNMMLGGKEGGNSIHYPSREPMSIYDAAMRYKAEGVPLVVFAGKEYGTGSSRDWAAKGTRLLGIRAVIAQSFERIHRSNLVGMGVLPLVFEGGQSWRDIGLTGEEMVSIRGLADLKPRQKIVAAITFADGKTLDIELLCRIDTEEEMSYYRNGGILPFVLQESGQRGLIWACKSAASGASVLVREMVHVVSPIRDSHLIVETLIYSAGQTRCPRRQGLSVHMRLLAPLWLAAALAGSTTAAVAQGTASRDGAAAEVRWPSSSCSRARVAPRVPRPTRCSAKLAARNDVLALSFSVDYWDYLGWKDTLANPKFTERQKAYKSAARRTDDLHADDGGRWPDAGQRQRRGQGSAGHREVCQDCRGHAGAAAHRRQGGPPRDRGRAVKQSGHPQGGHAVAGRRSPRASRCRSDAARTAARPSPTTTSFAS